jgi:hypothetical protein
MKTYVVISVLVLLFTQRVSGQSDPDKLVRTFKNAIHVSFGYIRLASIEYERVLFGGADRPVSVNASLSGGFLGVEEFGPCSELKGIVLIGRKSNHLEFNAGGMFFFDKYNYYGDQEYGYDPYKDEKSDFLYLFPTFNLGYRYQKPGGKFVFRLGTGNRVNMFYIGFGFTF